MTVLFESPVLQLPDSDAIAVTSLSPTNSTSPVDSDFEFPGGTRRDATRDLDLVTTIMDKETLDSRPRYSGYDFSTANKFATRADSFTQDTMMDIDALAPPSPPHSQPVHPQDQERDQPAEDQDDDNAIIQCICGFGKGYDDDDAISCDRCGTWQHNLCYFYQQPLPEDDVPYFCVECEPREIDATAAAARMRRKVNTVQRIGDQMLELECEVAVREEEITVLEYERLNIIAHLNHQGPLLHEDGSPEAWGFLADLEAELRHIEHEMERTFERREATRQHLLGLDDDQNRVRRNEPTRAEAEKMRWADAKTMPKLFSTAASLGTAYPVVPYVDRPAAPAVKLPKTKAKAKPRGKKRGR